MNTVIREERLLQIIEAPVISEKSTRVADKHQQAVFRVVCDATKAEIKAAVQHLFKVEVDTVQVVNVKGKHKRSGRFVGKRKDWKKAYVCLKAGQELNLVQGE
ncbi:MAG: 50S ribosomal protein L23 [Ferrovum sp.]|jgi:large subunit ribosomal protein L23|uniref:50S ribosomal protein L23 n=1 Tax=Ferrovum sp. TaxID=2609467 RepID=UPI0026208744|nr:50S ribosomal protein L23 [Ferrovum sp.]MBW8073005.1 50S ribosomal protein L23 [Ferrovum sp.]